MEAQQRPSGFAKMPAQTFKPSTIQMIADSSLDTGLLELFDRDAGRSLSVAKARLLAYFADECARDLDRLMTHFTSDAEVITPDGAFHGHAEVGALYRKSFDTFPGLTVDVKAEFTGRDAHCFEYRAVLSDTDNHHWLIEGINLMKLEGGLISSLRSFEDAPRRISSEGEFK
jgi:hypothetical protein